MTYETTISADKLRTRPQWKSEQQFINEILFCDGLPFHQADLTNLHYGMKYKGDEPAPVQKRNADGSITVTLRSIRGWGCNHDRISQSNH